MKCERIKQARKALGMSQEAVGKIVGVSKSTVSQWESGTTEPNGQNLVKLAKALQVTVEWIVYGVKKTNESKDTRTYNASIMGGFKPWDSNTPLREGEIEVPFFKEVMLSAGQGCFVELDHEGHKLHFSRDSLRKAGVDPQSAACVRIHGNSMEPVLPNGSVVGVDVSRKSVTDGKMYAIEQDGMLRVKILYRIPTGIRVRSYNREEYDDEEYIGEDAHKINIIGWVFWYSALL